MKKNDELEKAVYDIKSICPEQWAKVGAHLRAQAIPREGGDYASLSYTYVQKATIVGIMEELGFEF